MERKSKNIKISEKHHEILKAHCDKNGLKMYRVIEKWIDELVRVGVKKKDIYGES
jgi:hypothetical protein